MRLSQLVDAVTRIRGTTKRTEKVRILAGMLRSAVAGEIELVAFYLSGSLPQGKIGVGWGLIQKAMAVDVATKEPLILRDIDDAISRLAAEQGVGATEHRATELGRLFSRATADERRFLSQLLIGEIRQGALEGLILEAIAIAAHLPPSEIRQGFMFAPSIGVLARTALEEGSVGLSRFALRLFAPVAPMLANSADDVDEALIRLEDVGWEYKLDGARIQVHKGDDEVRIFTRQLQDVTKRLPEIVGWAKQLPAREAVLDGEALGLRPDGRPQPFQITMRRLGRQKDVAALQQTIPLSPFMFDALSVDGTSLITQPYRDRSKVLSEVARSATVPRMETKDPNKARAFFHASLAAGHEGIMAKSLTAPYSAGQRGFHWLKLKETATLDLVVLAAEWGNGRREGWLSNLHLGARDPESGQFVMLGKTFKGLTDAMLRWQTEKLLALETLRDAHTVFVRPELVVEIAFSDVQESPRYPARLALRFARVKRYRTDKTAAQADTIQTVIELFNNQRV
ncbi:MAG: ATP-dependent DNA ligase [Nitrospira sp. SG-bin1]|nr:MAG: ATP-dependent DNA ligase [Nitrospira sp. SG-bin1]